MSRELGETSAATLAVGLGALLVLLPLRFVAPRFPAPLVVVVGGIALSAGLALADHGVAVVGEIPSGLPSIGLPDTSVADTLELVPVAVGLFLVVFADAILTVRSYAASTGSTSTRRRSCSRSAPRTPPPASARGCRSAPAARAPPSATASASARSSAR